jgi:hypothetical protein
LQDVEEYSSSDEDSIEKLIIDEINLNRMMRHLKQNEEVSEAFLLALRPVFGTRSVSTSRGGWAV